MVYFLILFIRKQQICSHNSSHKSKKALQFTGSLRTVTFASLMQNFASQKEGCSHLNHFHTHLNNKCLDAERTVTRKQLTVRYVPSFYRASRQWTHSLSQYAAFIFQLLFSSFSLRFTATIRSAIRNSGRYVVKTVKMAAIHTTAAR